MWEVWRNKCEESMKKYEENIMKEHVEIRRNMKKYVENIPRYVKKYAANMKEYPYPIDSGTWKKTIAVFFWDFSH